MFVDFSSMAKDIDLTVVDSQGDFFLLMTTTHFTQKEISSQLFLPSLVTHRSIQQIIRISNPLSITRSRAKASLTIKQRRKRLSRQRTIEIPTNLSICLAIYKQTCHVKESTQFKKAVAMHAINQLLVK